MNKFVVKLQKTPTLHKTIITMFHTEHLFEWLLVCEMNHGVKVQQRTQ